MVREYVFVRKCKELLPIYKEENNEFLREEELKMELKKQQEHYRKNYDNRYGSWESYYNYINAMFGFKIF